jgi:hypothetical protein
MKKDKIIIASTPISENDYLEKIFIKDPVKKNIKVDIKQNMKTVLSSDVYFKLIHDIMEKLHEINN